MSSLSAFKNGTTYHMLAYGTMLGSTIFQSFIGGIVAFRALPRAQFSSLQKAIFPVYFTLQTITPLALLVTYPRGLTALLPFLSSSASSSPTFNSPPGQSGTDRFNALLIGTMFVTALSNLVYFGPKTTEVMGRRKHQETRDGKKSYDEGPHSKEMQALNKQFGMLHGLSTIVNLVGLGAMVWYGGVLGEGLRI